ncbi:hypothetical protein AAE478_006304 [Parahypoxylon ruwenzoriense]
MSAIFKKANTAVITGGASGIGLALARRCAGCGMRVLVADWDAAALEGLASDGISTIRADVSRVEDWEGVRERVVREFGGQINLLALNAGVSVPTSFTAGSGTDPAAFRKVVDANLFGVVNGVAALLPLIREPAAAAAEGDSYQAAVVITGSKQGITNPPGNPAYNASKAAVKAVAEQLSFELRGTAGVSVHLLVPGWTWTRLAGAASGMQRPAPGAGPWSPEQVVEFLEAKMRERKFWVLCPDNDVTEEMDQKRMLWSADDAVKGRPPLSRWRDEFKDEFAAWMARDL